MNNTDTKQSWKSTCPVPIELRDRITIAHGGGGRRTQELFERVFQPSFDNPVLNQQLDAANISVGDHRMAITTDSYVVRPIFFPGGNIGSLAVHGTINDLAVSGAQPEALTAAFVIEEGFEIEALKQIVQSMQDSANDALPELRIVCGDTKVIERPPRTTAQPDDPDAAGLIITTTGIGKYISDPTPTPSRVAAGDAIIISGPVGDHGMAIMSVREGLEFESPIVSDSQSLWNLVANMMKIADIHCMRDATRGGISSALNEIANATKLRFVIDEASVPIRESVASACEILGLDPFYVACEGRLIAFVAETEVQPVLDALRSIPAGNDSAVIGRVEAAPRGEVIVRTPYGALRPLDMLSGEQLPRIC